MIRHSFAALTLVATAIAVPAVQARQTPRPAVQAPTTPAPTPATPALAPAEMIPRETPGQPVNVKLEITITDQGAPGEPSRKTVSMVVADRASGSVRTAGTQIMTATGSQPLMINVDATPTLLKDGSIRLQFGLEYQPRPGGDAVPASGPSGLMPTRVSQINERLAVIVQDGKPLVISQAADAGSDRKVTVELKATVLK